MTDWIGTEPYKPGSQEICYDGTVGPCINVREVRRIADAPGDDIIRELRLYPYFFEVDLLNEPTFKDGGDPARDCKKYWMWIRRAMLRKLVHRIGYGGYLQLAYKYPDFIDYVEEQTKEFYKLTENTNFTPVENAPFKVAILNAWGSARPWAFDQSWPAGGFVDSMSGQPFDLEWIKFDDIKDGVPSDIGCIVNFRVAGTSLSGGHHWTNPDIVASIREFVDNGGGFVGIQDSTTHENGGAFFQLNDVLGIQKVIGLSNDSKKTNSTDITTGHFLSQDFADGLPSLGKHAQTISPSVETTEIAGYPATEKYIVINNSYETVTTTITDHAGNTREITLDANASQWFDYAGNMI